MPGLGGNRRVSSRVALLQKLNRGRRVKVTAPTNYVRVVKLVKALASEARDFEGSIPFMDTQADVAEWYTQRSQKAWSKGMRVRLPSAVQTGC
jgi:hypothetical protein